MRATALTLAAGIGHYIEALAITWLEADNPTAETIELYQDFRQWLGRVVHHSEPSG